MYIANKTDLYVLFMINGADSRHPTIAFPIYHCISFWTEQKATSGHPSRQLNTTPMGFLLSMMIRYIYIYCMIIHFPHLVRRGQVLTLIFRGGRWFKLQSNNTFPRLNLLDDASKCVTFFNPYNTAIQYQFTFECVYPSNNMCLRNDYIL